MANIKTLKDLTPGTVFDAGPIDVRVLDHMTNGTTLLIADKAVAWRPFSLEPLKTRPEEAPTPYPNDFSLLPEALFLKYKSLLALDDWWWLATPNAGYAYYARYVSADGSLSYSYAYYGYSGVRPAFFAESGIILESDGGEAVEGHE